MATSSDKDGARRPSAERPAPKPAQAPSVVAGAADAADSGGESAPAVAFKRRFLLPGMIITTLELLLVVWPAVYLFFPHAEERGILWRVSAPVLGGALVLWYGVVAAWLSPLQRAIQLRRRGRPLPEAVERRAYRATWNVPLRALLLRTGLWIGIAVAQGAVLVHYSRWEAEQVSQLACLVGLHSFVVNLLRAT
jgi:hypothetical protein